MLRIRRLDSASDGGIYVCKGVNGFGATSFEFTVSVGRRRTEPTRPQPGLRLLEGYLRDARVEGGDSATFQCAVSYSGNVIVRWLKRVTATATATADRHTVKLPDGLRYRTVASLESKRFKEVASQDSSPHTQVHALTIENATSSDAGVYACIAVGSVVDSEKALRFATATLSLVGNDAAIISAAPTHPAADGVGSASSAATGELTVVLVVLIASAVLLSATLVWVARHDGKLRVCRCWRSKPQMASVTSWKPIDTEKQQPLNAEGARERAIEPPVKLKHSLSFTRATAPDPASFGSILNRPRVYQTPGARCRYW